MIRVALVCALGVVAAALPAHNRPAPNTIALSAAAEEEQVFDPIPYEFTYAVNDDLMTNYQQRTEKSDGTVTRGSYTTVMPDGLIYKVHYTADPINGFQARVEKIPTDIKIKIPVHPPPEEQTLNQEAAFGANLRGRADSHRRQQQHQQQQQQQQQAAFVQTSSFNEVPPPPPPAAAPRRKELFLARESKNGEPFKIIRKITAEQARALGLTVPRSQ